MASAVRLLRISQPIISCHLLTSQHRLAPQSLACCLLVLLMFIRFIFRHLPCATRISAIVVQLPQARSFLLLLPAADGWQLVAGGLWGNSAQPEDSAWRDTLCVVGTTCTRQSADHWCSFPPQSSHSPASA
jgi:hypothetical protein